MMNNPDCTPGYYNNEGQPNPAARYAVGYPAGAAAYFKYIADWRSSGAFDGLEFR
jgi:cyclohexanone monooxygenase